MESVRELLFMSLLVICFLCEIACQSEISFTDPTRVRIARCRANCLLEESMYEDSIEACTSNPNCYICWEACEMIMSNYRVWGPMCSSPSICFPGCQRACAYNRNITKGVIEKFSSVGANWTSEVVMVSKNDTGLCLTTVEWGKPALDTTEPAASHALVYLLAKRKKESSSWEEISQTIETRVSMKCKFFEKPGSKFKIFALDVDGIVATKGVASSGELQTAQDLPLEYATSSGSRASISWLPELLSLIWGQQGTEAIVSWPTKEDARKYDVTWTVVDGTMDARGRILTVDNFASLCLWLDFVYNVQVSSLGENGETLATSSTLKIDTRNIYVPPEKNPLDICDCKIPKSVKNTLIAIGVVSSLSALLCLVFCVLVLRRYRQQTTGTDGTANDEIPVQVIPRKPMIVSVLSQEPIGSHVSLAKRLSRKLSNLELQYSPLSPLKQKEGDGKLLEFEVEDVFLYPKAEKVSENNSGGCSVYTKSCDV